MEVRRYLTRSGRDVFGEFLSGLRDNRTKAKIVTRIDRLAAGNFGDCKALRGGSLNCGLTGDRAIGFTTRWWAEPVSFCCVAEINANNHPTCSARWITSRTTGKGHYETQGERIPR